MKKEKGKGGFVFNVLKRADEETDVSMEISLALLPPLLCRRECEGQNDRPGILFFLLERDLPLLTMASFPDRQVK